MSGKHSHTPRPWILKPSFEDARFHEVIGDAAVGMGRQVCSIAMLTDDRFPERMANSLLIVSAPELLDQLEKAVALMRKNGIDTDEVAEMQFVLSRARGDV